MCSVQHQQVQAKLLHFLLPAIQHLLDYPRRKPGAPRILILTPTRELAMQVAEQAEELAQFTHLKIATITGGVAYQNHGEVFNSNQDIVVATPGRLLQYIKEENFDCRAVEMLILMKQIACCKWALVKMQRKLLLKHVGVSKPSFLSDIRRGVISRFCRTFIE